MVELTTLPAGIDILKILLDSKKIVTSIGAAMKYAAFGQIEKFKKKIPYRDSTFDFISQRLLLTSNTC